jgi:CPA1 family monovalent cation:H+ antiporter
MLTTVVAFGSYLGAEAVHVSGVIAVVAAGLAVGNYGMRTGMSPTTRLAVSSFWEYAAFAANSLVFLLLGIEVTVVNLWGEIGGVLGAVAIVLVGRAVAVYGLAPLAGRWEGAIPAAWRHVLFWGGLRGALSMALALGLSRQFPHREELVILTFGVVVFSLLGQGLTMGPLLTRLGLTGGPEQNAEYQRLTGERVACQAGLREIDRLCSLGALSRDECEQMRQEYQARMEAVERGTQALMRGDAAFHARQVDQARKRALLAEKTALQEAERRGWLDDRPLRPLFDDIDARLAELRSTDGGH